MHLVRKMNLLQGTVRSTSDRFDLGDRRGLAVSVGVSSLSGTSPVLNVLVEGSVDGTTWLASEGTVKISSPRAALIERHDMPRWARIAFHLSGTNPKAVFDINATAMGSSGYLVHTVAWLTGPPLEGGGSAQFKVTCDYAGVIVPWFIAYQNSNLDEIGSDSGNDTTDADGVLQKTITVTSEPSARWAVLSVTMLGNGPISDTESVDPGE